jgi:hypothetical protein
MRRSGLAPQAAGYQGAFNVLAFRVHHPIAWAELSPIACLGFARATRVTLQKSFYLAFQCLKRRSLSYSVSEAVVLGHKASAKCLTNHIEQTLRDRCIALR